MVCRRKRSTIFLFLYSSNIHGFGYAYGRHSPGDRRRRSPLPAIHSKRGIHIYFENVPTRRPVSNSYRAKSAAAVNNNGRNTGRRPPPPRRRPFVNPSLVRYVLRCPAANDGTEADTRGKYTRRGVIDFSRYSRGVAPRRHAPRSNKKDPSNGGIQFVKIVGVPRHLPRAHRRRPS